MGDILVSMKKYLYISEVVFFATLITTVVIQSKKIESITSDRDRLSANQSALMSEVDTFKTKDGLHAAKVKELTLKIDEFKKFRSGDVETINSLNADVKRLQSLLKISTQTDYKIRANVKDSIIYKDSIITHKLKCIEYSNDWMDFNGCIDESGQFDGKIQSRDNLVCVEYIIPKRFLGFLWKYGCKERRREIISKNPYTKIISAEFVMIKK